LGQTDTVTESLLDHAPALDEIELGDPRFFARTDVDAAFARLRAESPLHRTRDLGEPAGPDFWSVTRYEDVRAVSRDFHTFHNAPNMTIEDYQRSGNSILHLDPPEHTQLRLVVNKGFTPRMVERMGDDVRAQATTLLDAVSGEDRWDLVGAFAAELPLRVICALLGVPDADEPWLLDCFVRVFGVSDPANDLPITERIRVMEELGTYAHELGAARLDDPRDDLTTVLVHAEVEGDDGERHRLRPGDYARFFSTLAAAGSETSRNGIAHGVWLLDEHPDQRARLLADPEGVFPTAVEEIVRYASPVMHMRRNVAHDTELAGQPLAEGDRVVIWYRSANHDESVFDEPERFDVTRHPNDHLGYGAGGPHFCLGAHLARLEIRVALEELYGRFPELAVEAPPERAAMRQINGIKRLEVAPRTG
jgi:cytochrome P450